MHLQLGTRLTMKLDLKIGVLIINVIAFLCLGGQLIAASADYFTMACKINACNSLFLSLYLAAIANCHQLYNQEYH